ncbi:MAG TPA: TrmH family RNA methyltransferase [Candidatus Saccharimonadales bacterium]|nr:TrmH family RNA methyltransferase [Candidatus Saccharimonadales bacterium]
MRSIVVIAHDMRSTHNVGSLLRTCEGIGVAKVYFSGYTPYPLHEDDDRLPHLARKIDSQIAKTALGAEKLVPWSHNTSEIDALLRGLKVDGYQVVALEQSNVSIKLPDYKPPQKVAILLGREVEGIDSRLLTLCDKTVEIPMYGHKESYNVVQAAAMALYHCRFMTS